MATEPINPEPPKAEPDFSQDLKTFGQLSAKTKALSLLKDQAEKTTGAESVAVGKKIQAESTRAS